MSCCWAKGVTKAKAVATWLDPKPDWLTLPTLLAVPVWCFCAHLSTQCGHGADQFLEGVERRVGQHVAGVFCRIDACWTGRPEQQSTRVALAREVVQGKAAVQAGAAVAGAGGNIAADAVAKSAPDGNTLLMSFTSHAINASLYPSLPFDPVKDFTALSCVATSPSILVAHPA